MVQLYWLCIIGTGLLVMAFWFWIDDPMARHGMIASVVITSAVFAVIVGRGMRRQKRLRAFLRGHGPYFAFHYEAGSRSLGDDRRVRGRLCCFRSRAERDAWCEEAEAEGRRRAVSHLKLPTGWSVFDAVPPDAGVDAASEEDEPTEALDDAEEGAAADERATSGSDENPSDDAAGERPGEPEVVADDEPAAAGPTDERRPHDDGEASPAADDEEPERA